MALNHIELEQDGKGKLFITNEGKVQIFAGDPGTTVFATVELTLLELDKYIEELMEARTALRDDC
jgi:hypothetical protein